MKIMIKVFTDKEIEFSENILKISEYLKYQNNHKEYNEEPLPILSCDTEIFEIFTEWFNKLEKPLSLIQDNDSIFYSDFFKDYSTELKIKLFNFGLSNQFEILCNTIAYCLKDMHVEKSDDNYFTFGTFDKQTQTFKTIKLNYVLISLIEKYKNYDKDNNFYELYYDTLRNEIPDEIFKKLYIIWKSDVNFRIFKKYIENKKLGDKFLNEIVQNIDLLPCINNNLINKYCLYFNGLGTMKVKKDFITLECNACRGYKTETLTDMISEIENNVCFNQTFKNFVIMYKSATPIYKNITKYVKYFDCEQRIENIKNKIRQSIKDGIENNDYRVTVFKDKRVMVSEYFFLPNGIKPIDYEKTFTSKSCIKIEQMIDFLSTKFKSKAHNVFGCDITIDFEHEPTLEEIFDGLDNYIEENKIPCIENIELEVEDRYKQFINGVDIDDL